MSCDMIGCDVFLKLHMVDVLMLTYCPPVIPVRKTPHPLSSHNQVIIICSPDRRCLHTKACVSAVRLFLTNEAVRRLTVGMHCHPPSTPYISMQSCGYLRRQPTLSILSRQIKRTTYTCILFLRCDMPWPYLIRLISSCYTISNPSATTLVLAGNAGRVLVGYLRSCQMASGIRKALQCHALQKIRLVQV